MIVHIDYILTMGSMTKSTKDTRKSFSKQVFISKTVSEIKGLLLFEKTRSVWLDALCPNVVDEWGGGSKIKRQHNDTHASERAF